MKTIIAAMACIALLFTGVPAPPLAWANETESYRVEYRGPFSPLTENGADFFAHMDPFLPGQTQTGHFTCANSSQQAVMMEVRLVPAPNKLGQHLRTTVTNVNGEPVGRISPAHPESVELCLLQPGQEETFRFEATLAADTPSELTPETGAVRWEFSASEQGASPPSNSAVDNDGAGPDAGNDVEPGRQPKDSLGAGGPLPLTGDGLPAAAALALAAFASCSALALTALRHQRD